MGNPGHHGVGFGWIRPGHLSHISHDDGWVDSINPDLLVKKKAHNIIATAIALYW